MKPTKRRIVYKAPGTRGFFETVVENTTWNESVARQYAAADYADAGYELPADVTDIDIVEFSNIDDVDVLDDEHESSTAGGP